jgi:hypothetical protein
VERLNLAPEEEQQVKMIASQVDRDKKLYNSQIHSIASLKTLDVQTGANLQHLLTPALQKAQESASELQRSKEQMRKVKTLASVFNAKVPVPIMQQAQQGTPMRRREGPNLKYVKNGYPYLNLTRTQAHASNSSRKISIQLRKINITLKMIGLLFLIAF